MSNEDDQDRPPETESANAREHFKQGLGLLFRAAREAAVGLKRDVDRTSIARSIDDAGRELARAATNVVGRIEKEIRKVQPGEPSYAKRPDPQDPQPWKQGGNAPPDEERRASSSGEKPKGPTPDDPGFRIATDGGQSDSKPQ